MQPAISFDQLSKRYGLVTALSPLSLEVHRGEVLGYLGPNGAGKTTTIRALLGLIHPTSGRAEICGLDSQSQTIEAHRHLAYIPGESNFWPSLTGSETLHLLGQVAGQIDSTYRDELIKRFEFEPNKKVRTYSKGNRQKISLIAAFATRAEVLVMDEPTSGLDPLMERAFRDTVREARANNQTVFLSSHILSEVEALCDRVGILRAGKLVELGTLAKMRHLSALTVEATFAGKVPDLTNVKGISHVAVTDRTLTCHVEGPIAPLLHHLASSDIRKLVSHEPSLEELFLAQYGPDPSATQ